MFVGRKEADKVGSWRLGWFIDFHYKLKQVRTLRVLGTSTLSVVSAFTLCVRSGCLPLTVHAPESPLRLSPNSRSTVALSGLSTPITAIRHRCSSFCTWPTYLPLSPESFSRCRLRWTTPPSPQWWNDGFVKPQAVLSQLGWVEGDVPSSSKKCLLDMLRCEQLSSDHQGGTRARVECHQHSSDMKSHVSEWQNLVKPCRQKREVVQELSTVAPL